MKETVRSEAKTNRNKDHKYLNINQMKNCLNIWPDSSWKKREYGSNQ